MKRCALLLLCSVFLTRLNSHEGKELWMYEWKASKELLFIAQTFVYWNVHSFEHTYPGRFTNFCHTHKHKAADNERTIKRFLNQTYSVEIGTCIKHTHAPALDIIWIYRKAYNILADIRHSSKVIQNKRHYDPSLFVYICYHIRIMSRWL